MASNPFFSGRIPPELYQQAEKHCEETGKGKTELLIEALSAYLNFPVILPGKNFGIPAPEISGERIDKLEERVRVLEALLNLNEKAVIIKDNTDNKSIEIEESIVDNAVETFDNKLDNEKPKESKEDNLNSDNISDNNNDNKKSQGNILQSETSNPLSFSSIESAKVIELTGLTQSRINGFRDRILDNYQKNGHIIKRKELLEKPIVIDYKKPITVKNHPYTLIYLGQNPKGRALWDLIPDNKIYQPVIINDKTQYHSDNKENITEETTDLSVQEQVEQRL